MKSDCKYKLPCGWCDRLNRNCVFEEQGDNIKSIDTPSDSTLNQVKCLHEWEPANAINTAGYVYRCRKCGAMKTEPITTGLQEYISSTGNEYLNKKYTLWNSDSSSNDPCERCSNNPKNGGSGVCHCILGTPKVTCDTRNSLTGSATTVSCCTEPSWSNVHSTTQYKTDYSAGSSYTAESNIPIAKDSCELDVKEK